jgi:hypothetical protein
MTKPAISSTFGFRLLYSLGMGHIENTAPSSSSTAVCLLVAVETHLLCCCLTTAHVFDDVGVHLPTVA